jgi:hypothetical protein
MDKMCVHTFKRPCQNAEETRIPEENSRKMSQFFTEAVFGWAPFGGLSQGRAVRPIAHTGACVSPGIFLNKKKIGLGKKPGCKSMQPAGRTGFQPKCRLVGMGENKRQKHKVCLDDSVLHI